ncbi:5-formyltetrahydrofolate cyclo-ligase [Altibacter sp. HG106]|uniref:5-formyltetrahydrofolate cyclo-ligase n=1 Tax=Altibacter sp. HG106 TaxID=3023937 RepID=UPI002350B443|nr:5-formyltetrahydrofolate cyclo-ligase [Altibacter sp. HG106]MDC7995120.1 5-formyltetrahydrofolate cyclo-ligase [Altibacter sp. HG106]
MDKIEIRKHYKARRAALSEDSCEDQSLLIANKTLQLPIWEKTYFHLFLSMPTQKEVNTEYLLHILQGKDKSVVLSKSDFTHLEMQHYLLQEHTKITVSSFGIPEPQDGITIAPNLLDVVFVPLLAFDASGHRLGYGKGFYDRFLAQCRTDCLRVGLSYFEAEATLPHEATDIPLHFCVTPKKIYRF